MTETMTSLERVQRTIAGEVPDRVPVHLHNFLMTGRLMGYDMPVFLRDGEMLAEAQINAWRRFGHDLLLVENGVASTAGACGCEVDYTADGSPRVIGHVLAHSLHDVENLKVPDPEKDGTLPAMLKATQLVRREVGNQACVMGRSDQGPFALAAALRGYEQFLLDCALGEDMAGIHAVLAFATQVVTRLALAQQEAGAHCTSIGELGPSISSPWLYRQLAFPYDCEFIGTVQRAGLPVSMHICGNAEAILPEMVATGAKMLELDYKTDKEAIKRATAGKTTALGPIDPAGILPLGTPAEVREACREAIGILAPGGGFILGPGCALPPGTPPENVEAMVESAREFGRYS